MPIDSIAVGSNQRQIVIIGDPSSSSNNQAVQQLSDALNVSGFYAGIVGNIQLLINAGGTADRQRSAAGTTGIAAVNTEGTKATYSVGANGFTPAATPTDIFTLTGSSSKTIRVTRVTVSGTATSAASIDLLLIKRSSGNTSGTSTAPTPVPHDGNDSAATAVVNLYSANPTLGSAVGTVRAQRLNLGAAGAAGSIVWDFTNRNGKGIVLRGTAQVLAVNWNGAAVPSGTNLDIDIEFTEE